MPVPDSLIPSEWFAKAGDDIRAAELLLAHEGPLSIAAFHIQQAVEKYLKGYLLSTGWPLARIHDLEALVEKASDRDKDFAPFLAACQRITEYYIESRYPIGLPSPLTREEIVASLEIARQLAELAYRKIAVRDAEMSERIDKLLARLRKGIGKTLGIFGSLSPTQWNTVLYEEPYPWTMQALLAHFVSAEEALLRAARDIAAGGPGAPEGFDYDAFNATEQERLAEIAPEQLLADMKAARQRTIEWLTGLQEADLDRVGRHPALGEITLEDFVNVIYGHQLMHMRELIKTLDG